MPCGRPHTIAVLPPARVWHLILLIYQIVFPPAQSLCAVAYGATRVGHRCARPPIVAPTPCARALRRAARAGAWSVARRVLLPFRKTIRPLSYAAVDVVALRW